MSAVPLGCRLGTQAYRNDRSLAAVWIRALCRGTPAGLGDLAGSLVPPLPPPACGLVLLGAPVTLGPRESAWLPLPWPPVAGERTGGRSWPMGGLLCANVVPPDTNSTAAANNAECSLMSFTGLRPRCQKTGVPAVPGLAGSEPNPEHRRYLTHPRPTSIPPLKTDFSFPKSSRAGCQ